MDYQEITPISFSRNLSIIVGVILFLLFTLLSLPHSFATVTGINMSKFSDIGGGNIQVASTDNTRVECLGNAQTSRNVQSVNATVFAPGYVYQNPPQAGGVYRNATCTTTGTLRIFTYNCTVVLHHHSVPGTWTCVVVVRDQDNIPVNKTNTTTLDSLMSMSVVSTRVNFSKAAAGTDTGTSDSQLLFNNTGNVPFKIQMDAYRVSGSASDVNCMGCSVGTIPVGSFKYAQSAGVAYASKTALTDSPITGTFDYNDTLVGNTAYTNWTLYYGMGIPATGVRGVCTGFLSVTAVP